MEEVHPFTIDCSATAALTAALETLEGCTKSEEACEAADGNGVKTCQQAFFVLQAHHDYCEHDTLTQDMEHEIHEYEDYCESCSINRMYEPGLPDCITPACADPGPALLAYSLLNTSCVAADEDEGIEGVCCNSEAESGAFRVIIAYHDLCEHDDLPPYVETAVHDYEEACEMHLCNAVSADYDGTICPAPPTPPPSPSPPPSPVAPPPPGGDAASSDDDDDGLDTGAVVGIAIAAGVAALFGLCLLVLISKEKAGKPMFTNLEGTPPPASTTKS